MNVQLQEQSAQKKDKFLLKGKVHITKVILENFLSFKRDEVNFDDSKFIIVLGPNWSGKTSIFQGLKFVLGSNERDLRYPKWSDFIRHGQDHAMVEVTIKNGKESIEIRRTVVKDHSPYYSLKDKGSKDFVRVKTNVIQDIIISLNYNPNNHFAFVSQGHIDAIKDLKPTELCAFLEQGIGLKELREEILEKKIDIQTLNNELISLKTRKNSLSTSMDLLKPKLERLEKKKELISKKNDFEDELLQANRQKLLLEIIDLTEEVRKLKNQIHKNKQDQDLNFKQIQRINLEINSIEDEINNLSRELGENNYKKEDISKKIKKWQNEKVKMKQELDEISEKIENLKKQIKKQTKQNEKILNDLNYIRTEKEKIDNEIENLFKEQKELMSRIEANKHFLDKYNELTFKRDNLQKNNNDNEILIKDLESQIDQLFQSYKDINHKLDMNKWFLENPSTDLIREFDFELKKKTGEIFSLEENLKRLEIQRTKVLRQFKGLQSSLNHQKLILPTEVNILKDEIKKRGLKVIGPIINYIKYDDELSYAIESILGEKLLYSFVADDWDTLDLLKRLKNKYNAYCNIYVPKKTPIKPLMDFEAEGVIGYLADLIKTMDINVKKVIYSKVKNSLVVNDYKTGKDIYKKFNFKGRCVTLKGEQIISYKYVFETPYLKKLKGLLSTGTQKEQVEQLEIDIDNYNSKISELKEKISKLDTIQKDLYKKKEIFNDLFYNYKQKRRITTKKNNLYVEKGEIVKLNIENLEEINNLELKIKTLEDQQDPDFFSWNERIKEIPSILLDLNGQKKKWEKKLDENKELLNSIRQDIVQLHNQSDILESTHETKKEEFKNADKNAFDIYKEIELVENHIKEIESKIKNHKEKRNEYIKAKSIQDEKRIELELKLEQESINLNQVNQELSHKTQDLERIDSQIGDSTKENIKPRVIEKIQEDIYEIDKDLLKYYDVDDSILVEKDYIMSSLTKISKNQDDMESDIGAAIKTEEELEKTYYNKFQDVLKELRDKINNKFNETNIQVYCDLILIGEFEELGVDIKASTSNKPLLSCTALSGGQVSMVAIALILSLQEMKPSPLCMFDEASMFLDDKNSEISYELIKSTLKNNPIQLIMFLPKSSNALYRLAEKLIGVARVGEEEISTVFEPKVIDNEEY
ncbi:MAG: chromosome segregation protein SMC [Candidatus Lokiarchaeota archaeon]|nr:chromosome segregation protein SMC [Candidatus Lokiarchaeota archaeon]